MIAMRMRLCLAALALIPAMITAPALADEYAPTSSVTVLQALMRMDALNITDNRVIDEYAKYSECELYQAFHDNDFKWEKIRNGIRTNIERNLPVFPTGFGVKGKLYLDRYDFEHKMFRLGIATGIRNVNTLTLASMDEGPCDIIPARFMPRTIQAVLDHSVTVEGLYISEEQAKALLASMKATDNDMREIWARFNIRLTYAGKILVDKDSNAFGRSDYRFDAQLDSISFYEDKEMTKLVYTYTP